MKEPTIFLITEAERNRRREARSKSRANFELEGHVTSEEEKLMQSVLSTVKYPLRSL